MHVCLAEGFLSWVIDDLLRNTRLSGEASLIYFVKIYFQKVYKCKSCEFEMSCSQHWRRESENKVFQFCGTTKGLK